MAIQIANLTAQVGADTTQFKMGMNEVAARLEQVDSKAKTVINRIDTLRRKSVEATEDAADFMAAAMAAKDPIRRDKLIRKADRATAVSNDRTNAADDLKRDADAAEATAKAYAARLYENAREHQVRAFNAVSQAAIRTGTAISIAMVGATMEGSKFNAMLMKTVHNTSLSADGAEMLRDSVVKMGMESGANLEQLAHGFQKVENFSFSAADAARITEIAMRSSVATGSDMAQTSELLAKSLVQFSIGADEANNAMNVMHVAANLSSLEMSQLVAVGGQTYSMASNLGVSFVEANAALVTFTKLGLNAHEAMTQFRGELNKLIHPTVETKKALDDISKKSGVDLNKTFTLSTLKARGLTGVFDDIREAARRMNVDVKGLANELFPAMRGTIGAMISSSDKGFKIFTDSVNTLNDAMSGKLDPTTKQYEETMKTTEAQINRAKNAITLLEASIATALSPTVIKLTGTLTDSIKKFTELPNDVQKSRVELLGITGVSLIVIGSVGKLIVGIASLKEAFIALTGVSSVSALFAKMSGSVTLLTGRIVLMSAGTIAAIGVFAALAAGIAVLAGGAYYYTKTINDVNDAQNNMNKASKVAADSAVKEASANKDKAKQLNDLVGKYDELHKITKPTKEQTEKLHGVLNKISDLAPDLITGYDKTGNAIGLIGDYAKYSAAQLAEMNKQLQIAQARQTQEAFADERDFGGRLGEFKEAIKNKDFNKYSDLIADPQLNNVGLATQMKLGSDPSELGKRFQSFGIKPLFGDEGYSTFMNDKWRNDMMRKIDKAQAKYRLDSTAVAKATRDIFNPKDIAKPDPSAEGGGVYNPPGKTTKDKKKRDPLDVYRDFIESNNEKIFKATSTDPLKDAWWLKFNEQKLRPQLEGIKSVSELMEMAKDSAANLNSAMKRIAENKSFDTAIAAAKAMGHKPKSQRLGDIARWEVGNPYADVWSEHTYNLGSKTNLKIMKPDVITGNDPDKRNWLPNKKQQYIKTMDTEQRRRDTEIALKQHADLIEAITAKEEKQKTVFEQTIEKVRELKELYAKVGEFGAFIFGAIAQQSQDNVEIHKQSIENLKNYASDQRKQTEDDLREMVDAFVNLKTIGNDINIFGRQMTSLGYVAEYALKKYGKEVKNLTLDQYAMSVVMGGINEKMANTRFINEYTSNVAELDASTKSLLETEKDYDSWLMGKTGMTPEDVRKAGKFNGLSEDQYHNLFDKTNTNSQAASYRNFINQLRQARIEVGGLQFDTYDAEVAWKVFGTTIDKLTPEMLLKVQGLGDAMKQLEQIQKMQLIWSSAAATLEESFTRAFESVLTGQQNFWKVFGETIKNSIARILASEAAKEIVRFIAKVTGLRKAGQSKEERNDNGNSTSNSKGGSPDGVDSALSVASMIPGVGPYAQGALALKSLFRFAKGGRPEIGRAAIVGENGPELFIPDNAGSVYSANKTSAMISNKPMQIHVTNTGDNYYRGDMDAEVVASKTANKLVRKLRYG